MKNEEKIKKAEILLEAIGEIDDGLLDGAMSYRKRRISARVLASAAVFMIMLALVAGSAIVKRFSDMTGGLGTESPVVNGSTGDMADNSPAADEDADLTLQNPLESMFVSLANREAFGYVTDPDSLPYLDGNAYIVWRYEGEGRYYLSAPLKDTELETVKSALGSGRAVGSSSPDTAVQVWVLLGDGRVISPYLEASNGNISNEIFEYEVEIVPDERFAEKILLILS